MVAWTTRELWYVTREESPSRVRVRHHKPTGAWETLKYRGDELVASAEGPDFEDVMIQTTLVGLTAEEPVVGECWPGPGAGLVGLTRRVVGSSTEIPSFAFASAVSLLIFQVVDRLNSGGENRESGLLPEN